MKFFLPKNQFAHNTLFLIILSGVVYLPHIGKLTYYLDDWYYIYDGIVGGPNIFHTMFSVDRPLRGYLFDVYFSILGANPFLYHLSAYIWRVLAGIFALEIFRLIWPTKEKMGFWISLLFVLYPGYSWWVSSIEYQPMLASLAFQILSYLLTLKAIVTNKKYLKVFFTCMAIITGWIYIGLVDYAIGMEGFRFLCVYLIVQHNFQETLGEKKLILSIKKWAPSLIGPLGFIFWRFFIFENQRKTTDITLMIEKVATEANIFSLWWTYFYRSVSNVSVFAWYKQLFNFISNSSLTAEQNFAMLFLIIGMLVIVLMYIYFLPKHIDKEISSKIFSLEAMWTGFTTLCLGILPIVFAGRYVNLTFYSHYSLPISLAAAILLFGFISYFLNTKYVHLILLVFVIFSGLTNSVIALNVIRLKELNEDFWWQTSWRIPDFYPDTTIVTLYPDNQIADNEFGLPEPVNLIYFPEHQSEVPIQLPVSTLMPYSNNIELILSSAHKKTVQYRTHKNIVHYRNILILVQPTPLSCVRVIGNQSPFSRYDSDDIKRIAPFSKIENIRIKNNQFHIPPEFAFGQEPPHNWCYFFQKADLSVQKQNWQTAANLGNEVISRKLQPYDEVEWFPFIQAYAMTVEIEKIKFIALQTQSKDYFNEQVCNLSQSANATWANDPEVRAVIDEYYCR